MCTAQLWYSCRKSSNKKLIVTFNDVMRFLFQVSEWHSDSQQLVSSGVVTCKALMMSDVLFYIPIR